MEQRPNLPIDGIDVRMFNEEVKEKYLDKEGLLSDGALDKIRELFSVGRPSTGRVCCDEYHAHSYRCIFFYNPATAVVDRLIYEVIAYKARLDEIKIKVNEIAER